MQYTNHYSLKLPQTTDPVRVNDFNQNTQAIENKLVSMEISQNTATKIWSGVSVPQSPTIDSSLSKMVDRFWHSEMHTCQGSITQTFALSFVPKFALILPYSAYSPTDSPNTVTLENVGFLTFHNGTVAGTCTYDEKTHLVVRGKVTGTTVTIANPWIHNIGSDHRICFYG